MFDSFCELTFFHVYRTCLDLTKRWTSLMFPGTENGVESSNSDLKSKSNLTMWVLGKGVYLRSF
jgi:hypothetical protein